MNEMPQPATVAAKDSEAAPVVFLHGVQRSYRQGTGTLDILKGAELALWPGQIASSTPLSTCTSSSPWR